MARYRGWNRDQPAFVRAGVWAVAGGCVFWGIRTLLFPSHFVSSTVYVRARAAQLGAVSVQLGFGCCSGKGQYVAFLRSTAAGGATGADYAVVDGVVPDSDSGGGVSIVSSRQVKLGEVPPDLGLTYGDGGRQRWQHWERIPSADPP